jgi:hypothetical protein
MSAATRVSLADHPPQLYVMSASEPFTRSGIMDRHNAVQLQSHFGPERREAEVTKVHAVLTERFIAAGVHHNR